MLEHQQVAGLERGPHFVVGQRRGGDDCDAVFRRGVLGEIDRHVCVDQMRGRERPATHDVVQVGRTMRE